MARAKKLSLLSVEALFKLRDDVAAALNQKAEALKKELRSLGEDYAQVGRTAIYGRKRGSSLKGRKAPIKYRDKSGNTWAGRGAQKAFRFEKDPCSIEGGSETFDRSSLLRQLAKRACKQVHQASSCGRIRGF